MMPRGRPTAALRLLLAATAAITCTRAAAGAGLGGGSTLSLLAGDTPGGFSIAVNGAPWFSSGNVSVTVGGSTYALL